MKTLPLIAHDPWLEPFTEAIVGRHNRVKEVKNKLTRRGKMQLSEFASGHLYYGLHRQHDGFFVKGLPTLPRYILSAISPIGKSDPSIS